jgi:hypothetical protein
MRSDKGKSAAQMLSRFSVDEALIGDLIEQRQSGRSTTWLCFQTVVAISRAVALDIRRRPARAVLAVVFGLMLREAYKALWSLAWHYTNLEIARSLPVGFVPLGVELSWIQMLLAIPGWIVIGWLVARLDGAALVLPYIMVSWILIAPDLWRQASNAVEDARFRPYFSIGMARETLFGLSVLAGCLRSRRPRAGY